MPIAKDTMMTAGELADFLSRKEFYSLAPGGRVKKVKREDVKLIVTLDGNEGADGWSMSELFRDEAEARASMVRASRLNKTEEKIRRYLTDHLERRDWDDLDMGGGWWLIFGNMGNDGVCMDCRYGMVLMGAMEMFGKTGMEPPGEYWRKQGILSLTRGAYEVLKSSRRQLSGLKRLGFRFVEDLYVESLRARFHALVMPLFKGTGLYYGNSELLLMKEGEVEDRRRVDPVHGDAPREAVDFIGGLVSRKKTLKGLLPPGYFREAERMRSSAGGQE
ncbi:MAG: hypothetical protein J6Y62_03855 [Clostridia bacterium]|nr:hypothetical protein [Clostridia bacterium]